MSKNTSLPSPCPCIFSSLEQRIPAKLWSSQAPDMGPHHVYLVVKEYRLFNAAHNIPGRFAANVLEMLAWEGAPPMC